MTYAEFFDVRCTDELGHQEIEGKVDDSNPFRSPVTVDSVVPQSPDFDPATLKKFRDQIHALGALWIILGLIVLGLAAMVISGKVDLTKRLDGDPSILLAIFFVSGSIWLVLGILACFKLMPAVYTGLVLTYLSAVGNLINLNICAIVICAVIILQAHRVISLANVIKAAGVPLNAKPL